MTYELIIGDRAHSSWSMRPWLLVDKFEIPVRITTVDFSTSDVAEQLAEVAPVRTVPALRLPEGIVIAESVAIAEELATRHADLALYPSDPSLRALARWLSAEMAAGFTSLRNECPMNLRTGYKNVILSDGTQRDIDRIETIWENALNKSGGPWLCGDYSIADAFFAPVAARIAGYGIHTGKAATTYVEQHLKDPSFRRWRAMGLISGQHLPWYDLDHEKAPWPGPAPLKAQPVEDENPENELCPYSGKPTTHFMRIDERTFGFCNAFCRDKTVADPAAWPDFMKIYNS